MSGRIPPKIEDCEKAIAIVGIRYVEVDPKMSEYHFVPYEEPEPLGVGNEEFIDYVIKPVMLDMKPFIVPGPEPKNRYQQRVDRFVKVGATDDVINEIEALMNESLLRWKRKVRDLEGDVSSLETRLRMQKKTVDKLFGSFWLRLKFLFTGRLPK